MRLTDEMKSEIKMISYRTTFLNDTFLADAPHATFSIHVASLKEQHGGELESYKVKLENFYLETDVKEKPFKYHFISLSLLVFFISFLSMSGHHSRSIIDRLFYRRKKYSYWIYFGIWKGC